MTITLNGTSGIVNDATALNYTGTLTGGTGVVNLGSGQVYKDASGNVGIGTISPILGTLHVLASGTSDASMENVTYFGKNSTSRAGLQIRANATTVDVGLQAQAGPGNIALTFSTLASGGTFERARIDSSGNLLVGTTTNLNGSRLLIQSNNFVVGINGTNTSGEAVRFYSNGSTAGTISYTATTVSYNTSSDYRLKDTIAPMTGALAKVALLKPCTYKWKVDGSDGQGFIAHELAEVEVGCVTGEKDAVDSEGKPQYQGIDTSFLVATLTAALQELKAIVDAQTARITALEGAAA